MRFRFILLTILLALICANGWALEKSTDVNQIRSDGSKRLYLFHINDVQIGSLESHFDGGSDFANTDAYRFSENLELDFKPIGQDYSLTVENKHYIDENGFYVGDDMDISLGPRSQKLYLKKTPDSLTGYYVTNDQRQDVARSLPGKIFAADNNMIDQFELFLAFHDIKIGDTINDTIFVPQVLLKTPVSIVIEGFDFIKYGKLYDSAYVCHFYQPTEQIAYFTKDKKLIRLEVPSQKLNIILSESALEKMAPKKQAVGFGDFIKRIPIYLIYLILGIIITSAFIWRYHKKPEIYVAFVMGGLVFMLMGITQIPLQKWYSLKYMLPGIEAGGSLYLYAVIPTLISGVVQEILKLIPITILYFFRRPKQNLSIVIGIFCGFGFGLYEAGWITGAPYQAGTMAIFSWAVLERIFTMIFHMTTGAALGYGINRGVKHLSVIWVIMVLVHSFMNYMIIFVQKSVIDIALFELLVVGIDLVLLLGVYLTVKSARR